MLAKRMVAILSAIGLCLGATGTRSAAQEERMVLGQDQYKFDNTKSGAVLCVWAIYLETQAATKACGSRRRPVDDAIDRAILDIDDFIIANSSLHPTRAALNDFKRRAAEASASELRGRDLQKFCDGPDLEGFRSSSPEQVAASVRSLLSVPREPVMNPCL
jgi:hypothetical protein